METILLGKKDRIATITLNRPDKRNAINAQMVTELKETLAFLEKDNEVKVVLLKAKGKVFSAGADLAYLQKLQQNSFEENLEDSQHLKDLFYQIYTFPKLVVAQVEGAAIAGGCGLATVCDFCFSVPEALFGYSEVKIGFIPALVSIFISRKIGEGRAKELLLTGKNIRAGEAVAIGLINATFSPEEIAQKVWDFSLRQASGTSSESVLLTKMLLAETSGLSLKEALEMAAEYNARARNTDDCQRGISSFLAKEKISW